MASDPNKQEWQTIGLGSKKAPKRGEGTSSATKRNSRSAPSLPQRPASEESGRGIRGEQQLSSQEPGRANDPRSNVDTRQDDRRRYQGYGQSRPPQTTPNRNTTTGNPTGKFSGFSQAKLQAQTMLQQTQSDVHSPGEMREDPIYQ